MKTHLKIILCLGVLCSSVVASAAESSAEASPYRREIGEEQGQMVYTVTRRAPHLFMISRDLYGQEKNWSEIARWNKLQKPYEVTLGQKLVLNRKPTLSEAEADRLLIKTWSGLGRKDVAQGIAKGDLTQSAPTVTLISASGAKSAPVKESSKEIDPAPKGSEEAHEPTSEHKAPAHTEASAEEGHDPAAHPHKKWSWGVALIAVKTQLDTTEEDGHTIQLATGLDYGLDLTFGYHLSDTLDLHALAAIEQFIVHSGGDGALIVGGKQNLVTLGLGLGKKLSENWGLSAMYKHKEEPIVHPAADGIHIEKLFLSQLTVGPRWTFVRTAHFESTLGADYLYSGAKNEKGLHLKAGQGYEARLDFGNHLKMGHLVYGVSYRSLKQDTDHTKDKATVMLGHLGLHW